jgi:hypothetical protein
MNVAAQVSTNGHTLPITEEDMKTSLDGAMEEME